MTESIPPTSVRQLRLVVEAEDYDAAVAFYRDALGLSEQAAYEGEGDAKVMILNAGMATLEISNPAQVRMIDWVEAEGKPSARIRIAFEVDDSPSVTADLVRSRLLPGATSVARRPATGVANGNRRGRMRGAATRRRAGPRTRPRTRVQSP